MLNGHSPSSRKALWFCNNQPCAHCKGNLCYVQHKYLNVFFEWSIIRNHVVCTVSCFIVKNHVVCSLSSCIVRNHVVYAVSCCIVKRTWFVLCPAVMLETTWCVLCPAALLGTTWCVLRPAALLPRGLWLQLLHRFQFQYKYHVDGAQIGHAPHPCIIH